jgi:OmpA-OmpF porin, OOP family
MKEKSAMQIEIAGHTDNAGPESYNMSLSERRARSVVRYLTEQGVDAKRINTLFFGESKPLESNSTSEGRRKNRRVEFKIVKM